MKCHVFLIDNPLSAALSDFAFVHMEKEEDARTAIEHLNGREVKGKRINVELSNKAHKRGPAGHSGQPGGSTEKNKIPTLDKLQARSDGLRSGDVGFPGAASAYSTLEYDDYQQRISNNNTMTKFDSQDGQARQISPSYFGRDRSPLRRSPTRTGYMLPIATQQASYRDQPSASLGTSYRDQPSASLGMAYRPQPTTGQAAMYRAQPSTILGNAYRAQSSVPMGASAAQSAASALTSYGAQSAVAAYSAQPAVAAAYGTQSVASQVPSYGAQPTATYAATYGAQAATTYAATYGAQAAAALSASYGAQPATSQSAMYSAHPLSAQSASYGVQPSVSQITSYGAQAASAVPAAAYGTQSAANLAAAYSMQDAAAASYKTQLTISMSSAYRSQASNPTEATYAAQQSASMSLAGGYRAQPAYNGLAQAAQQAVPYSAMAQPDASSIQPPYERTRLSPPRSSREDLYRKAAAMTKRYAAKSVRMLCALVCLPCLRVTLLQKGCKEFLLGSFLAGDLHPADALNGHSMGGRGGWDREGGSLLASCWPVTGSSLPLQLTSQPLSVLFSLVGGEQMLAALCFSLSAHFCRYMCIPVCESRKGGQVLVSWPHLATN